MQRKLTWLLLVLAVATLAAPTAQAQQCPPTLPVQGAPPPLPVFPADNWWNTDISNAPVDSASPGFITFINNGGNRKLHPDFGGEESPGSTGIYGFPYAIVGGTQAKQTVTFDYADESDGNGIPFYPIPAQAITQPHWVEGGAPGNIDQRNDGDRHLLIIDCSNRQLYELYNVWYSTAQQKWQAGSGAFFDMTRNDRRPDGWTSADAAGLAIFPGLVRYDEAANPAVPEINHALRVTMRTTNGYVYPASHKAGSTNGALPMGARLRLKTSVNGSDPALRTTDPTARKIFRAMQKYGLIVADNGSDMYISGTFDVRWDNGTLNPAFSTLSASDFEVIQRGWKPPAGTPVLSIANASISEGDSGMKALNFTVQLSQAATVTVSYSIATANGTATAGSDYVARALTGETIAAGQTSKTFAVNIIGDTLTEAAETFTVTLSAASGATIGNATATGTILDDDAPPLSRPLPPVLQPNAAQGSGNATAVVAPVTRSNDTTCTAAGNPMHLLGTARCSRLASLRWLGALIRLRMLVPQVAF